MIRHLLVWATVLLTGCAREATAPAPSHAAFGGASGAATDGPTLVVIAVSAVDMPTPYMIDASVTKGVASATLVVPAGALRYVTVRAYDAKGAVTNSASTTLDVPNGKATAATLIAKSGTGLNPITAHVTITGTTTQFTVTVTPDRIPAKVGGTVPLVATVRDVKGAIVPNATVTWATSNPSIATVDAKGTLQLRLATDVWITATYAAATGTGGSLRLDLGAGDGSSDDPLQDETVLFSRPNVLAGGRQIYEVDPFGASGPTVTAWTSGAFDAWEPTADNSSPSQVAFDARTDDGLYHIFLLPTPLHPIQLDSGAIGRRTPAYSPPGQLQRLAFTDTSSHSWQIFSEAIDGRGGVSRITQRPGNVTTPSYSPDGQWLAFAADDSTNVFSIYRSDASGANAVKIASLGPANAVHPTWSSDSRTIAFAGINVSTGQARVYTVPAAGGAVQDITPARPLAPGYYDPSWSRHGPVLACTTGSPNGGTRIVALDISSQFVFELTAPSGVGGDIMPVWRRK